MTHMAYVGRSFNDRYIIFFNFMFSTKNIYEFLAESDENWFKYFAKYSV